MLDCSIVSKFLRGVACVISKALDHVFLFLTEFVFGTCFQLQFLYTEMLDQVFEHTVV